MKTHTIPGLFILFISILCLSSCSSHKLPTLKSDDVILAFGDSLTAGVGVQKSESYPTVLAQLTGLQVINAGVTGETTTEGLKRLPELLNKYKPGLVILLEGGNDVLQKVPESQIKANLAKMIQSIQNSGSAVLLVGAPEKKLFGNSLELYAELANEFNIPIEEDIVANLMKRLSMKSDYVHFNQQGYQAMAEAIYKQLISSGAIN
ncbi:GDSL-type esterase/lipase family protein [Thiomicrorhabdus sp. Kp2]|uniref:GDSL-type esterase/lipase family protein n=1 Tax=Thiomicrorhabdus sp. Kp2 TaxID=1123518 RepID=UPI0003FB44DB|nr:GDSL-type esterase/lipase family protein [Thiomicrorhabdus sp. Kp2]